MWKDKLGNYLIDISKYVTTGVVIASLFKDFDNKAMLYVFGLLISITALIAGLVLTNNHKDKKGK